MKKLRVLCFLLTISVQLIAQNEGRIGIYAGINKTSLANADDKAFGDYLPTFKPTLGVSAGYHFTLFKVIPTGFTAQVGFNQLGQNYRGYYADSTDYYAYSRLNYMRMGLGWHIGSNIRRLVSVTLTNGISLGFLTNYQEKYELIRYNNDRVIMDIRNTTVVKDDSAQLKGTLSNPLYNKTDLTYFGSLDFDFMLSKNIIFGLSGRFDYGLSQVENISTFTIYYNTEPTTTTQTYKPYNKFKYREATVPNEQRASTNNVFYGVYVSLKYRIFNEEKHRIYYKERRQDKM